MDELLDQAKLTNQLLRLAFGAAIEARLAAVGSSGAPAKIIAALRDGEDRSMDELLKLSGLPRSSLYAAVATLERQGVLERARRGYVTLSRAAAPYLPGAKRNATAGE